MRLKTSETIAIERGLPDPESTDIQLLGTESLSTIKDFKLIIESGEINSSKNSFVSIFNVDVKFFYSVELRCENRGFIERGLGYVEQRDGKFYLKRSRPFYYIENGAVARCPRPRPIVACEDDELIVSSHTPTTYVELLTDANSIITSILPHLPTSVVVDKNSVLGRLEDNIQSIPISDLVNKDGLSEIALNAIKEHTKNLILKSSKVDVKRLTANDIQLNARKSAPERKGVIYYDEQDNVIKYYDGEKWRVLAWTEDA